MAEEFKTAAIDPIFAAMDKPGVVVLPTAVFLEDAAVIAEQPDHVVLTFRLPIDLIRKNHLLLKELLKIAAEKPTAPAEPEEGDLDEEG